MSEKKPKFAVRYICSGDMETKRQVGRIAEDLAATLQKYADIMEKTKCVNCPQRSKGVCIDNASRIFQSIAYHFFVNVYLPVIQYTFGPEIETEKDERKFRKLLKKNLTYNLKLYCRMSSLKPEKEYKRLTEEEQKQMAEKIARRIYH